MYAIVGLLGMATVVASPIVLIICLLKKKPKITALFVLLAGIALFFIGIATTPADEWDQSLRATKSTEPPLASPIGPPDSAEPMDTAQPVETGEPVQVSDVDITLYLKIDDENLFEYGQYMANQKVVTVITVKFASGATLKAFTDNNDGIASSITCEMEPAREATP